MGRERDLNGVCRRNTLSGEACESGVSVDKREISCDGRRLCFIFVTFLQTEVCKHTYLSGILTPRSHRTGKPLALLSSSTFLLSTRARNSCLAL